MKKITSLLIMILILISSTVASAASFLLTYDGETHEYSGSTFKLMVNNKYIQTSVEPLLFNDYSLVPVREVFENLGATVRYIDLSKQIFIEYKGKYLRLKIGSNTAYIDANELKIPGGITPMLISVDGQNAKTMVPTRFVSESLGINVGFDASSGTIKISDPDFKETATLYNFKSSAYSEMITTMEIYSDSKLNAISTPILTNANVLYFDVYNATSALPQSSEISQGPVRFMRVGIHDSFTRIALDVENCQNYKVALAGDGKTILVSVTQKPVVNDNSDDVPQISADGKIVVIDAGHGGSDPGANGNANGKNYLEKTINLSVARKVRDYLAENGVNVIMTREGDTYPTLTDRSDLANYYNAAIFTSIHSNSASSSSASGFEVYYSTMNNDMQTGISSSQLADAVMKSIASNVSLRNRGVKTADHVVTRTSTMPAILVEIGFMSNPSELSLMVTEEFQNEFAKAVAEGILSVLPYTK